MTRTRLVVCLGILACLPGRAGDSQSGLLESRIDVLLREWAAKTSEIKSLYTVFRRTTKDVVWGRMAVVPGSARYLAPDRARLDISDEQGKPEDSLVVTGKGEIWHYQVSLRKITVYELDPGMSQQQALEEGPLPFLFATKPEKAKQRYSFEILDETDEVVRAKILPKLEEDKKEFLSAEVTLDKKTFLPKRLYFVEVNQNEVTYDFASIWTNIEINPSDFEGRPVSDWPVIRKEAVQPQTSPQAALPGAARAPR